MGIFYESMIDFKSQPNEELKNLGYSNGWQDTPDIVKLCRSKNHLTTGKEIGRCLTEYSCKICGYKYKVDSSD